MHLSRRTLVKTGLVTGGTAALSVPPLDTRPSAAATLPTRTPFNLGVASGDPLPTSVIIWTRLAVNPLADNGLGGMSSSTQTLRWQVATDATFGVGRVVRSGTVSAYAANAHSVHVEVDGLRPGRDYFYRFRWPQGYISPVGRTRTAPAADDVRRRPRDGLRLVRALRERLLHRLPPARGGRARTWCCTSATTSTSTRRTLTRRRQCATTSGPEIVTLADYRQRHAQYKTDPDLQAAHAVAPWAGRPRRP